ncbi:bifunctional folylpolyglutamate synthase/dihydrofolate synthase [Candidatus Marsarchaeota archaeon]|nr:bifunctional folylpolyglutamate synthase/dihydrofolate synthase [Candidatus Marsarchaeota archaeon]
MEIKTFSEAKAYLESLPFNKKSNEGEGLGRMSALLQLMGNPQNAYPAVHIGGTAGKGSTSTMIASMLMRSGYKVGLHISPHLEDMRERAQVNMRIMSKPAFVRLVNNLSVYSECLSRRSGWGLPTYFEALLALSFQHFKEAGVEIGVIEVGLGGRYDGTNVILPKVAIITNVGLDHTEILGDTVDEIATDKSGIIKPGISVISGALQPSVVKILEKKSKEERADLKLLGKDIIYNIKTIDEGTRFDLITENKRYTGLTMSILGEHQVANAALAISAVLALKSHGFKASERSVREGLLHLNIPGRFEIIMKNPEVILDGAHNPMKIEALVKTLKARLRGRSLKVIFAAKKDKNVNEMIKALAPLSSKFYFTAFESNTDFGRRMSYNPAYLSSLSAGSESFDNFGQAWKKALSESSTDDVICITGSLYLVGEARSKLL